jgi:site-specific DNA-adenine methylase
MLKPFFTYYGGKYRAAPLYPAPRHGTIVEPFAGSAGYSLRYPDRNVVLCEIDPIVASVWEYLVAANPADIRALPLLGPNDDVQSLIIPQEAKWLVGFWLNKGASAPRRTPSAWMRAGIRPASFWGEAVRERIASQVERIRHWKIVRGSYADLANVEATWFVDPPYAGAGKHYRHADVDYTVLADWCRGRRGQTIVCENEGAAWLPFKPFGKFKANESRTGGKTSSEVVWVNDSVSW